jgi:SAM-dependent methyltransferase
VSGPEAHWRKVYQARSAPELSWYQPVPERSIELILATGIPRTAPILDVGGGASTLVDHLLGEGFTDLTILDLAPLALAAAKTRLGPATEQVQWITADITEFRPARRYALWHDRAVFHFLVGAARRQRYLDVLKGTLAPGGHLVLGTFGPQGPTQCSGLEVQRYSVEELGAVLGPGLHLVRSNVEDHITPSGSRQQFLYGWWELR